jgi:hypothetical protein
MATLPGVLFYSALGFRETEPVADTLPDGTVLRFIRMKRELDLPLEPEVDGRHRSADRIPREVDQA